MALSPCQTKTNRQGRELAEHGTAFFPVACYEDDLSKEAVPWHWHDELEAVIVSEGTAVVAVDHQKYTVEEGNGFFINAGLLHACWDGAASHCRLHSVVFHPRLVGGGMDSVFWQNYIRPLTENSTIRALCLAASAPWHREALHAIETAWQECVIERPGYEFRARAALSQLVFLLCSNHPTAAGRPSEKEQRNGKRMKRMLQYIQEHYCDDLNTASIAQSALISESECLRCFRNTIGAAPIQYLRQFRIHRAAELLAATEQKIADIGTQCGFPDTSYFTKSFRELKGCTPTEYRKRSSGL